MVKSRPVTTVRPQIEAQSVCNLDGYSNELQQKEKRQRNDRQRKRKKKQELNRTASALSYILTN